MVQYVPNSIPSAAPRKLRARTWYARIANVLSCSDVPGVYMYPVYIDAFSSINAPRSDGSSTAAAADAILPFVYGTTVAVRSPGR